MNYYELFLGVFLIAWGLWQMSRAKRRTGLCKVLFFIIGLFGLIVAAAMLTVAFFPPAN